MRTATPGMPPGIKSEALPSIKETSNFHVPARMFRVPRSCFWLPELRSDCLACHQSVQPPRAKLHLRVCSPFMLCAVHVPLVVGRWVREMESSLSP